jgi:hypothetical protein
LIHLEILNQNLTCFFEHQKVREPANVVVPQVAEKDRVAPLDPEQNVNRAVLQVQNARAREAVLPDRRKPAASVVVLRRAGAEVVRQEAKTNSSN